MSNIGNKEVMSKNLKYYVGLHGKSQKEMSEIVGVAPSTFNDWMQGKKYPRIDKIEILANYFKILKSDLIEEKSEDHREIQKNNDTIIDAVAKMREDEKFLSVVESLLKVDADILSAVEKLLLVLQK